VGGAVVRLGQLDFLTFSRLSFLDPRNHPQPLRCATAKDKVEPVWRSPSVAPCAREMSALPPPIPTELMRRNELPLCARTGCEQSQQRGSYSITASARAMSIGGTSRPSALALRRLMINSKCVGCSTGRSEGLLPLRILSTKYAHRTNELGKLGP
jgi:hypothetical protein